jgi:hypothetical protein
LLDPPEDARLLDRKLRPKIDEVRDQWSHRVSRPEQEALIRRAVRATAEGRPPDRPRALMFLGGDIHVGGLFDLTVAGSPLSIPCAVSSGISQVAATKVPVGLVVDERFEVAPGIRSALRQIVQDYNFGVVQVIPTGRTPVVVPTVLHRGRSTTGVVQLGR